MEDVVKKSEGAEDVFFALWEKLVVIAFGIGFTMGTWSDGLDPNIKAKIEQIRVTIKQKGIFYFAPKARA